jgi:hypothetical protein
VCIAVLCFALLMITTRAEKRDADPSRAPPITAGTGNNAAQPSAEKAAVKQQQDTQKKTEGHVQQADEETATWEERPARYDQDPDAGSEETAQDPAGCRLQVWFACF